MAPNRSSLLRPMARRMGEAAVAVAVVWVVAMLTHLPHTNPMTDAFAFLITVLVVAARLGLFAGLVASIAAALLFSYHSLQPIHGFGIVNPENWIALLAFLVCATVGSRLVSLSRERERLLAERSHLQTLKESEALKTSILRAVSHDLRTPLTAIRMGIELARAEGDANKHLEDVSRATERLSRRIDNLLALARLEAGTLVPHVEPTPAQDLFRSALENLPLVLEGRSVEIAVEEDCPDVSADPTLTVEVLVNLLENAARLAPADLPILLAASRAPSASGASVRLEVADRGPGVPEAVRTGQRRESDTGRGGLGLEICRTFASALGGTFALRSRPGGGTVAFLDLPAAPFPTEVR